MEMEYLEASTTIAGVGLLQMSYFSRQNPFTRPIILPSHAYNPSPKAQPPPPSSANPKASASPRASRALDNPFEKSRFDQVFTRRDYQSENKRAHSNSSSSYLGTYIPLSRLENRMRLKLMDDQNWKREKDREERLKLEQYGADGLRYSSYSTAHTSFNHYDRTPRMNKKASKPKQQKLPKLMTFDESPRSEYMLYTEKPTPNTHAHPHTQSGGPKNKNGESNTSIFNKNEKAYPYDYQNRYVEPSSNNLKTQNSEKYQPNTVKSSDSLHQIKYGQNKYQDSYGIGQDYNNFQSNSKYDSMGKNPYRHDERQREKQMQISGKKNGYRYHEEQSFEKAPQFYKQPSRGERKQSPQFTKSNEFMGSSFHRKEQPELNPYLSYPQPQEEKQSSAKSLESDLISDKFPNLQNMSNRGKLMSYGSNLEKDKPNFYDSDYINQDEDLGMSKGPLSGMKFSSSSFDSDNYERKGARPSRFGAAKRRDPDTIRYAGREYYQIKLLL